MVRIGHYHARTGTLKKAADLAQRTDRFLGGSRGEADAALEEIINLRHPLVRLAREIDWDFDGPAAGQAKPSSAAACLRMLGSLFRFGFAHSFLPWCRFRREARARGQYRHYRSG
jgi:hypothetical protein